MFFLYDEGDRLVLWSGDRREGVAEVSAELRKDRPFTVANPSWRVYLDNYDLLERVSATGMVELEGTSAPGVLALREEYQVWQVPRNEKKSVERSRKCELQGATVDGVEGLAYPKEAKLAKYFSEFGWAGQGFATPAPSCLWRSRLLCHV